MTAQLIPDRDGRFVERYALAVTVAVGFAVGLACRHLPLDKTTSDTFAFLLPWYDHMRQHGVRGLGTTFTNYTPFYSYLLLGAVQFDGWASPLHLIKAISFVFEFGCAVVASLLVRVCGGRPMTQAAAFVLVWVMPTALYNGAMWGQADSIWTFFCLLSVYLFCRDMPRAALIAFAMAFSVKAQAVFLAPLVFAFVLSGRLHWMWLFGIPVVYLLVAAPALLLGQPIGDVLTVYLNQAGTFERLSMNAANFWMFVDNRFYRPGVIAGLGLAAASGLVFSIFVMRSKSFGSPRNVVLAAGLTLLLMPFVLPKMHDRYFYAFELMAIVIATIDPRMGLLALAAQLNGLVSYLVFEDLPWFDLRPAALGNTLLVIVLTRHVWSNLYSHPTQQETASASRLLAIGLPAIWLTFGAIHALRMLLAR